MELTTFAFADKYLHDATYGRCYKQCIHEKNGGDESQAIIGEQDDDGALPFEFLLPFPDQENYKRDPKVGHEERLHGRNVETGTIKFIPGDAKFETGYNTKE